ncbi:hypothetical protein SESBI_08962 [Sesbania bispinosa]|nr:hypothetical protein SESBI_08962 [Sesbania bispinosa]
MEFDRRMVVLKELNAEENPNEMDLTKVQIWMGIYKVPLALHIEGVARSIGDSMGSFIE